MSWEKYPSLSGRAHCFTKSLPMSLPLALSFDILICWKMKWKIWKWHSIFWRVEVGVENEDFLEGGYIFFGALKEKCGNSDLAFALFAETRGVWSVKTKRLKFSQSWNLYWIGVHKKNEEGFLKTIHLAGYWNAGELFPIFLVWPRTIYASTACEISEIGNRSKA